MQYEGAIYHVMSRGDHREDIFRGAKDRELFLKTLGEACGKTDWQIHAWCVIKVANCLALEAGNDDDTDMDSAATEHGNQDAPVAPARRPWPARRSAVWAVAPSACSRR